MYFNFEAVIEYFPYFLPAAWYTIEITTLGIICGLVLGLITAFARLSHNIILNKIAGIYIFVIRGTPLLLQLLFLYFGLRSLLDVGAFASAIIALGVHNGAYIGEIFRGAIKSISVGQMEAARSLGMPYYKAMRRIILPQAIKRAIPALGNQFIIALKDSSLASVITIKELLLKAQQLASSNLYMMEMLMIAAFFYLFYTSIFTWLVHKIEEKYAVSGSS